MHAAFAQYDLPLVEYEPFYGEEKIQMPENGNYYATCDYYSHTRYQDTYTLIVTVYNDRVKAIHFSDGASLHDGINSSNYTWVGGKLFSVTDYHGNIAAAKAEINITNYYSRESVNPNG